MPVAISCGRVLRARTAPERVEACIKAAEVLTRYISALSLASYASIDESIATEPLMDLSGSLAFGHFLSTVQQISQRTDKHLLAPLLAQGFKKVRRNSSIQPGPSDRALITLLEIRNQVGHQLSNLDEARAISIEREHSPGILLIEALNACEEMLRLPLFIIENQRYTKDCLVGLRLLLMGESNDPLPEEIQIQHQPGGFTHELTPYVGIKEYALALPPSILWDVDDTQKRFDLFFVDQIKPDSVRYRTLEGAYHPGSNFSSRDLASFVAGDDRRAPDHVILASGLNLSAEWRINRQHLEDTVHKSEGRINWSNLDMSTVELFARLIKCSKVDPTLAIKDTLLHERDILEQHELRQINLLFGLPKIVRNELKRDLLDMRIVDQSSGRPTQRELVDSDNLLTALGKAVKFLSRDLDIDGDDLARFTKTDGSFDYIAVRELLINQIVHQDYQDQSAPAQIEIYETSVSVFNVGHSLLEMSEVLDGGKSQSRNPLIARALRLAGFAEVSGSGIRALQRACLNSKRPAPEIVTDRVRNTFALVVKWGEKNDEVNAYWKTLLGVALSQEQADVLDAIRNAPSMSIPAIEAQTGYDQETVVAALDFLELQVLVTSDDANYSLADHLLEHVK